MSPFKNMWWLLAAVVGTALLCAVFTAPFGGAMAVAVVLASAVIDGVFRDR